MTKLLRQGDHIRLKVRTIFGWKGKAIVIRDQLGPEDVIAWRRDSDDPNGPPSLSMRHEVVLETHN